MKHTLLAVALLGAIAVSAQTVATDTANTLQQYEQIKLQGRQPVIRTAAWNTAPAANVRVQPSITTQSTDCDCMVAVDSTFQVVPFSFSNPPDYRNDDGSSGVIPIPFNFCFYGQNQTSCYINNNGNISFGASYATFSAVGFPSNQFSMVAPFWADVDTRGTGSGLVYYKVTPSALIVRWQTVGYFASYFDKLNDFQLIITDGVDPLIPGGNNVSFCYGDMQWTTGDASGGSGGFGGTPATVGANLGNGVDYIQFGQFDAPGSLYDGPFGNNDQISWLDNQNFVFNTCAVGNIPPIPTMTITDPAGNTTSVQPYCGDTLRICEGNTVTLNATFFAPEPNQTVTVTHTAPQNFTIVSNTPGPAGILIGTFTPDATNFGINTFTFTGTDNGTPVGSATFSINILVDTFQLPPPVIAGLDEYCQNTPGVTLSINNPGYDSVMWNPGPMNIDSITGATQGTYIVTVADNGCFDRDTITITELPAPVPVITGVLNFCGTTTTLSAANPAYSSYVWSNNTTTPVTTVGSGNYTVTVVDTSGCTGTSASVTVNANPVPQAAFIATPPTAFAGDTIAFTDQSTVSSGSITSWMWDFGDGNTSTTSNPTHSYGTPGSYNVCLYVATATPCYDTICNEYVVLPFTIIAPNIITPNGDGVNDNLVFFNLEFYPNARLTVYNRWGSKVYENTNYQNNWDGGGMVDGVYYYVVEAVDLQESATGFFHIIRGN
jgi:gliding motility-associated-like protein